MVMETKWPTKKLGECLVNLSEKKESVLKSDYLEKGEHPVIDQGQDFIGGYTNDDSRVYKNDLPVVIFGDHTRAIKFVDFPFSTGADGTKILKPSADFAPRFFYLAIKSVDLENRGYGRHFKILKETEIPLPPLPEQKRIVKILDEKLGKVREAIRLREEALADTKKILPARLREIFEKGKEEGWEEKELGDMAEITMGQSPSGDTYNDKGEGLPLINGPVEFGPDQLSETVVTKYTSKPTKICEKGDLLLCVRGSTTGRTNIAGQKACLGRGVASIKAITRTVLQDLLNIYIANYRYEIYKMGTGSTFPNVSSKVISSIKIFLPDLKNQTKIVAELEELSARVAQLRALQTEQLSDLKKLERAYLREAFNGDL